MITLGTATALVLETVRPLPIVQVPLAAARGAVLAEDLVATFDTPPFDASAMDGYAVRAADVAEVPVRLQVIATSSSGHPSEVALREGCAIRILTGAVVPAGADCVVPVESTDGRVDVVTVERPATAGQHIRRRGEVGRSGEVLIAAGTELTAGHVGVVASTGRSQVAVHRRPRVAVVTTGDELVAPGGAPLGPGQIYDSNGVVVRHLVAEDGD
ncbi:MAG: molybdopterin molybdotransferase MoeA, partial [Microthrixaceae bacterium]